MSHMFDYCPKKGKFLYTVYEPCLSDLLLSIIKAAIGSNYTASSLQLKRDLSLQGRVLLSKAEGISRPVYDCLSLDLP